MNAARFDTAPIRPRFPDVQGMARRLLNWGAEVFTMKNMRFVLTLVAMLPVFALIPACTTEVVDDGDIESMEAIDTPEMETEWAVGCNKASYVGVGSCTQSCTKVGTCVSGAFKWSCSVVNYEHWKGLAGENNYFKISGPLSYQFCQNTNPVNCPAFCN